MSYRKHLSLAFISLLLIGSAGFNANAADEAKDDDEDSSSKDASKQQGKGSKKAIPAGNPVIIGKQKSMTLPAPPEFLYIDKTGKQVIPYTFYEARDFKEGLAAVQIVDQWGFINKQGEVLIGARFDIAGDFAEGLAPVKVKNGWGYVDRTGKMVIEPRFAVAENFKNGLAVVQLGKDSPEFPKKTNDQLDSILKDPTLTPLKKAWLAIANSRATGVIDKKGKFLFDPFYSSMQNFSDDLALAREGSTTVFLNKKGQVTLRPVCQDAKAFSEGMAAIKVKDKWGFINTAGGVAIKPVFEEVEDFQKGLAPAKQNGKWGFINKKGRFEIPAKYDVVWEGFGTGIAVAGLDRCPIPNTHAEVTRIGGGFIVSRHRGGVDDFDESTSPLEPGYFAYPDYRFTLIDRDGKAITDKQYDHIGPLSDGIRVVRQDGQFGYIDNLGNMVLKPKYQSAESFCEGLALVKEGKTTPRLADRNESLLKQSVPALVSDPDLIRKDIEVCGQVIKLDPTNAQAFRDRGYLLCSLARFQDSLSDFDEVIRLCSSSSEGYYWRGMANMQLSRFSEAAVDFTNAIEMEPSKPQNLLGRALALKALKRSELALGDITRAMALYDHPYYHKIRGELLDSLGQSDQAMADLQAGRRAPSLNPWPVGPRTQEEIWAEVVALQTKLRTTNPNDHTRLALNASELADALEDLRRLKQREDKVLELDDLYSQAVAMRRKALKEAEKGTVGGSAPISYKTDLSNTLAQYAGWHVRTQEFTKANQLYEEALNLAKDINSTIREADYLSDIGRMYAAQKQYEKAKDYLKKSLVLTRNPVDLLAKTVRGQTLNAYAIVQNHLSLPKDAAISMKEASELLKFGTDLAFIPNPPPLPENASDEESYELALQCRSLGLIETSKSYMKKAVERSTSGKLKSKAECFLTAYMPKKFVDLKTTKAFQKGRAAETAGDLPLAERYYTQCLESAPDFEWPYQCLSRLNRTMGELSEAEKLIKKALTINPSYVDGWLELAQVEREKGDTAKAKEALDKALALDPECQVAQLEQRNLN